MGQNPQTMLFPTHAAQKLENSIRRIIKFNSISYGKLFSKTNLFSIILRVAFLYNGVGMERNC